MVPVSTIKLAKNKTLCVSGLALLPNLPSFREMQAIQAKAPWPICLLSPPAPKLNQKMWT